MSLVLKTILHHVVTHYSMVGSLIITLGLLQIYCYVYREKNVQNGVVWFLIILLQIYQELWVTGHNVYGADYTTCMFTL